MLGDHHAHVLGHRGDRAEPDRAGDGDQQVDVLLRGFERLVHLRFPSKEVPMGFIFALFFAFLFGVGLGLMRR